MRAYRARIREAEKKQSAVTRAQVGLSEESLESVAVLVERGVGRAGEVMREALERGLRVMLAASVPQDDPFFALPSLPAAPFAYVPPPNGFVATRSVPPETTDLVSSALGLGAEIGRPITEPEPTPEVEV